MTDFKEERMSTPPHTSTATSARELVDTDRYPIDDLESDAGPVP